MNIGFDAKRAFLNSTGLGNYSRFVIRILAEHETGQRYFLYTPETVDDAYQFAMKSLPGVSIRKPSGNFFKSYWRSRGILKDLKQDGISIYHGLSNEIPIGIQDSGIKSVVTIHDLIFLRYPEYYSLIDRKIYEGKFKNACLHADAIIAVSENTKRDIAHYFGTDLQKIKVLYQGCDPVFNLKCKADDLQKIKLRYALPDQYLLHVGTIEPRKNLLLIAKALRNVPAPIKLVVIGKKTRYAAEVEEFLEKNQLSDRVVFLKNIPFRDLPAIYQQAKIFIYPSRYEGFGIPILEALCSGVPVIAATGSCLEEAGGKHSLYIGPDDDDGLAEKINAVLNDVNLQSTMREQGYLHAQRFDEKILATQLRSLYESLV